MNVDRRHIKPVLFRFACLLLLALFPVIADVQIYAAPDDVEPPPLADANPNNGFFMDEANFDQWVFQGAANAEAGRQRIRSALTLKVDELKRVCQLTEAQERKLRLAGSGDIKRFFDDVEVVRGKFREVQRDQNKFNQIWQDIQPLQLKQSKGLFGEGSLFAKTILVSLTPEQSDRFRALRNERQLFLYKATIESTLVSLGSSIGLRDEQHNELVKLLLEHTKPPESLNLNEGTAYVQSQLRTVPRAKLKALLDERQLQLLDTRIGVGPAAGVDAVVNGVAVLADAVVVVQEVRDGAIDNDAPADAEFPVNLPKGQRRIREALRAVEARAAEAKADDEVKPEAKKETDDDK